MDHDSQIEEASGRLHAAVAEAARLVGKDVARSLLIHYLHLVDTGEMATAPVEPAA